MFGNEGNLARVIEEDGRRDLRTRLRHFMKATNLSMKSVAAACALHNEKALDNWISGNYTTDPDGVEEAVKEVLGIERDAWAVDPNANVIAVFRLCDYAKRRNRMVACSGASGYGKTTGMKLYARVKGALYYCYDEAGGYRDVLKALCRKAGVTCIQNLSCCDLRNKLVAALKAAGIKLIIIDQADTLPFRAVEAIRSVYDEAGIAVAWAGLEDRLLARLMRRNARENAAQVFSRISAHIKLPAPTVEDITTLADRFGVKGVRAVAFIHRRAAIGGYRTARVLLEDGQDVAEENGLKSITFEAIQKGAEYLLTTVRDE